MSRVKVLLDLDDVCCDLIGPWLQWHNSQCENQLTRADVTDWDWSKVTGCRINMYDYLRIPGVFRNLKLYAGCSNTIHDLLGVYEFIAVTSRPEMHHLDTAIWLGENLPYINDLYFSDEKWLIEGAIIIEDKPSTLIKCQEAQFYTITMDAPYNRYVSGSRVKDWLDVNHLLWSLHYYG